MLSHNCPNRTAAQPPGQLRSCTITCGAKSSNAPIPCCKVSAQSQLGGMCSRRISTWNQRTALCSSMNQPPSPPTSPSAQASAAPENWTFGCCKTKEGCARHTSNCCNAACCRMWKSMVGLQAEKRTQVRPLVSLGCKRTVFNDPGSEHGYLPTALIFQPTWTSLLAGAAMTSSLSSVAKSDMTTNPIAIVNALTYGKRRHEHAGAPTYKHATAVRSELERE